MNIFFFQSNFAHKKFSNFISLSQQINKILIETLNSLEYFNLFNIYSKIKFNNLISLFFVSFLLLSCVQNTKNKPSHFHQINSDIEKLLINRPDQQNYFLVMVKLKHPAILSTQSNFVDNKIVKESVLNAVLNEQIQFEKDLSAVSAEIKIVYRYKFVLNAFCLLVPKEHMNKVKQISKVSSIEEVGFFKKPDPITNIDLHSNVVTLNDKNQFSETLVERNSAKFIGSDIAYELGFTGKKVKVGVIDTGIDYTHKIFNGIGTEDAYKAINPSEKAIGFPNDKIIGGIDLVGTEYDSASPDFWVRLPKPDVNPIDEGGHGTHVAGTIAGIGDYNFSYNGVAPDAQLYAIKVFGANGSTSDMVVIAALEYSIDPNGDNDIRDQLDVVNLSLGSGYGNPKILYAEAIKNLVNGGTIAVISAGNSGNKDYIVGAPGTSTEAISVAASIDNTDHNWKFSASEIKIGEKIELVQAISAATTQPISETQVEGEVVFAGLAAQDFTNDEKALINGRIALIDRGVETFNNKVKRAFEAGAIGVIVANNKAEEPFSMGTIDQFSIPAIMISQSMGNQIKKSLKDQVKVNFKFKTNAFIEKPELIDTITSFSSKGPRSFDGYIKPEISAPGSDIISAAMGKGSAIVKMSGTSMAAPHMAGVMALFVEKNKQSENPLTTNEMKNLVMGTSKSISHNKNVYPVSRQGAGRVSVDRLFQSKIVANISSLAFGQINLETKKTIKSVINFKNISEEELILKAQFKGSEFVVLKEVPAFSLNKAEAKDVSFILTFDSTKMNEEQIREMDGWIEIYNNSEMIYQIPVLAIAHKTSSIVSQKLIVNSSKLGSEGALTELEITNLSSNNGEALLFNQIDNDLRKPSTSISENANCDLQSAGYRIIEKEIDEEKVEILQIAIKTFKPMTTWNSCDVSVVFKDSKTKEITQELVGTISSNIPGLEGEEYSSHLIDFKKAREIRKLFEKTVEETRANKGDVTKLKDKENYKEAIIDILDMKVYNNSTIAILEMRLNLLTQSNNRNVELQVLTTHNEQNEIEFDDYLSSEDKSYKISLDAFDQSFLFDLESQNLKLKSKEAKKVDIIKGRGDQNLLILYPYNVFSNSDSFEDQQLQYLEPQFRF